MRRGGGGEHLSAFTPSYTNSHKGPACFQQTVTGTRDGALPEALPGGVLARQLKQPTGVALKLIPHRCCHLENARAVGAAGDMRHVSSPPQSTSRLHTQPGSHCCAWARTERVLRRP